MKNLSENSTSYGVESDIYQAFSDAEDYPNLIFDFIKPILSNTTVLDLGCGNGKYSHLLSPFAKITGVDKSWHQVQKAKIISPHIDFIQADCLELPFNAHFDFVLCCWMLGTLVHPEKQKMALNEIKKTLKKNGKIILIENDTDSDFEKIRGRDKDDRTKKYNHFLLDNGFTVIKKINTYFQFKDCETANYILKNIWGDNIKYQLKSSILSHQVLIFSN